MLARVQYIDVITSTFLVLKNWIKFVENKRVKLDKGYYHSKFEYF